MLYTLLSCSCALFSNPKLEDPAPQAADTLEQPDSSGEDSGTLLETDEPIENQDHSDVDSTLDGQQGALITSDCLYETYTYAIDILLSCGNERFNDELRLHTFKRHSHSHKRVFNDQRITYREKELWFDSYSTTRCIWTDNRGRFYLSTQQEQCDRFNFIPDGPGYLLQEISSGECAGLGEDECTSHQWTGGDECGGVDHRYLSLRLDDCDNALRFSFASEADECNEEYPESNCF